MLKLFLHYKLRKVVIVKIYNQIHPEMIKDCYKLEKTLNNFMQKTKPFKGRP